MSLSEASEAENRHEHVLPLTQYQFWLDAIRNDDSQQISRVLETSDTATRSKLLNGSFQFPEIPEVKRLTKKRPIFTHPFTLAALYGSMEVCDVMVKYDVNVLLQEKGDFNVFHCLVCIAFCQPHNEDSVAQSYTKLCRIIPAENIARLLRMEDTTGLRPLEFAVHQGALKMMMTFFETPGIYKIREDIIGVRRYRWYDITEYETDDVYIKRHVTMSLMHILGLLDERHFYSDFGRHVFTESIIADWIRKSVQSKRLVVITWFLLKMVYTCAFCVYQLSQINVTNRYSIGKSFELHDESGRNNFNDSTHCDEDPVSISLTAKRFLESYLILQSFTTLLYDSVSFVHGVKIVSVQLFLVRDLSGTRKKVAFDISMAAQRYVGLLFAIMVIAEIAIYNNPTAENVAFLTIMHLCQAPIITCAILHHMEIFQSIGHMVLYIRRMLSMLVYFIILCECVMTAFMRLFIMSSSLDHNGGCLSQFSDFLSGAYSMILLFLNTLDIRGFSTGSQVGFQAVHVCFVFGVGILLYNLLIALFSDEINKISENRQVLMCIDYLWTVCAMDHIALSTPLLRRLYIHLRRPFIKRTFVCMGGKIFLVLVDSAKRTNVGIST